MKRWGRWKYDPSVNVLRLDGGLYEIDLDTITTAASCLDWIFQASNKTWMTNEDRGNLLLAIQETVNPQRHLCPWGIAKAKVG